MGRELYQLVAITTNNMEYIVELKNENKNNRGYLNFIDSGTARFESERSLATYLYEQGKIPTTDVRFAVKYNHEGPKYLPIILNDRELAYVAKSDSNTHQDYIFYFLKLLEAELHDPAFYRYVVKNTTKNAKESRNGNHINIRLLHSISEYYDTFVKTNDNESNKAEIQYDILEELFSYKQLRTLRMLYYGYRNQMIKEEIMSATEQEEKVDYENMVEIPDDIANAYKHGGMDEVYSITDLDNIESKRIKLK